MLGRQRAITFLIAAAIAAPTYAADPADGTISLQPGDTLHSMQTFAMTGLLDQRTLATTPLVDSTPAVTLGAESSVLRIRTAPRADPLPATGAGAPPAFALLSLAGAAALAATLRRR